MRDFTDEQGRGWTADVVEEDGTDYKGRLYLVIRPAEGEESEAIALPEVRWNSRATAERTIGTMSVVELRRRLRVARGRAALV